MVVDTLSQASFSANPFLDACLAGINNSAGIESLRLPPLNSYFYATEVKEMLPLIGSFEHPNPQVHLAMDRLNKTCRLGLNDLEISALSKMLSVLAVNPRFGSDFSLEPAFGENPTAHSIHSVLLAQEAFRRADLLDDKGMLPVRLGVSIGLLLHDLPEMLNELSSLVQRAINTKLVEVPAIEAQILIPFLKLAVFSSENESFAGDFFRLAYRERERLALGTHTLGNPVELLKALDSFSKNELNKRYLTSAGMEAFERLLSFYYVIELSPKVEEETLKKLKINKQFSEVERFVGYAGSIIEHIQGTRHLLRFGTRENLHDKLHVFDTPSLPVAEKSLVRKVFNPENLTTIPLSLSPSYRIRRNVDYLEKGVGEMFECAALIPDNAKYMKLAKHIRNMAYETIIELASCYPVVFNLEAKSIPEIVTLKMKQARAPGVSSEERAALLKEVRRYLRNETRINICNFKEQMKKLSREDQPSRILPLESEERVTSLYQSAIERDYIPKAGEILLFRETVPEELSPLELTRWHQISRVNLNPKKRGEARSFIKIT